MLTDTPHLTPSAERALLHAKIPTGPATGSVLGWLPYLWQRVLFRGQVDSTAPAPRFALLMLVGVSSLLIYPFLNFHLFEPDEGRYAQIPWEMATHGTWLVPTLQGEPYLDKPPLLYWLVRVAYAILGPADWVARLVPALAIQVSILLTYVLGRKTVGARPAFWGSLLLCLAPGFVSMGRILVLDGLLSLWVTASLLTGLRAVQGPRLAHGWWAGYGLTLALGVLTKGPVAIVLAVVPLLMYRWLMGNTPPISRRAWLALFAMILAVNVPWYLAITLAHPEFASYFLWKHNLQRFLQPFDHERPVWFFGPVLLAGLGPVVALLPGFVSYLLADRPEKASRRSGPLGYFLVAGTFCVAFFSLSGSKLPTYILPAFPPLCLALGAYVTASGRSESVWLRRGLATWALVLFLGHAWGVPAIAWIRSPMNHAAESREYLRDPNVPIFCFPRHVDSVAFYLGRSDLHVFRSKELPAMLQAMDRHERSVLLFAHRSSRLILDHHLPPHFHVLHTGKLGLCDLAVIQRKVGSPR